MSEKLTDRSGIAPKHQWDLTPLFKNNDEWETLFAESEQRFLKYNTYKGRLGESAATFLEILEFDLALSRDLEKLFTYAHLKNDEDKSNQTHLAAYQRISNLWTRVSEAASFITPEIQHIPEEPMTVFLADSRFALYRTFLNRILRYKPHTLTVDIEEILAKGGELEGAPSEIFEQLDNADLTFGTVQDDTGKEIELTHGNFNSFLMNHDRSVRKTAFFQYYRTYDQHKNAISAMLAASIKKDKYKAEVRRFTDCRKGALFSDNVPDTVYDNLIATVKKNLPTLFTYLDLRKKALNIKNLHFYDTYVPLVSEVQFHMPYEKAVDTCIDALAPLGDDYTKTLKEGLLGGWVDRYENRGKRSGAYSSGCYDSPPYILMNYKDDNINSLYTLIHEAGHSMHSYYSNKAQPYLYHGYTIFVAEVASTLNETLLSRHLVEKYKADKQMGAYIVNREIDNIRGTLIRQTMFAEFECLTHQAAERNEPLTLEVMTTMYRQLLETYFGSHMVTDDILALECLRIPHFYSPFYVYKYATGISAAIALAGAVAEGDAGEQKRYLDFLKMGGTEFPLDELKAAGVDMSEPAPVQAAFNRLAELIEQFAKLL